MMNRIPWERLCDQGAYLAVDPYDADECDVLGCARPRGHHSNHHKAKAT